MKKFCCFYRAFMINMDTLQFRVESDRFIFFLVPRRAPDKSDDILNITLEKIG